MFALVTERKIRSGRGSAIFARSVATAALDYQNEEVRAVIRMFLKSDQCRPRYKGMAPTVLREIGDIKIGDVRRSWIKSYLTDMKPKLTHMGRPFSWATLNGHARFIGLALRWRANELDIAVPHFPYSTDLLPKRWQGNRDRRLSSAEEAALMATLSSVETSGGKQWPLLVGLALETGARLQELVLAEWSEVDFDERLWTLPLEHTKSKYARCIPLSIKALDMMAQLKAMSLPGDPRIFHAMPSTHGVSNAFRRHSLRAGLVDFHFHDLRHEAISRMVLHKRKLSVYEIMKIVGHGSLPMLNRYANLRGDELANRMD